jgi:hypothetical protein
LTASELITHSFRSKAEGSKPKGQDGYFILGIEHIRNMYHRNVIIFDTTQKLPDRPCRLWEWVADSHGTSVSQCMSLKLEELGKNG